MSLYSCVPNTNSYKIPAFSILCFLSTLISYSCVLFIRSVLHSEAVRCIEPIGNSTAGQICDVDWHNLPTVQ
jgi:hypothetical protein